MTTRAWRLVWITTFALALLLRVGLTAYSQGLNTPQRADANPDAYDYERFAANLAAGKGYCLTPGVPSAQRPPGTSFLLLPTYCLFGPSVLAARLWLCLLSACTVPLLMHIGRRIFDSRVGIVAGLALALTPAHWYYVFHFLSETPTALLTLLGTWLTWESAKTASWKAAATAGLVWGLAVLVRPNLAMSAAASALIVLCSRTLTVRARWRLMILMASLCCVVVLPWVVRNAVVMGKPTICTVVGGATFYGSNNDIVYHDPRWIGYWWSIKALDDAAPPDRRVTSQPTEVAQEHLANRLGKEYAQSHLDRLPVVVLHRILRVLWAYPEYPDNRIGELLLRWSWFLMAPYFFFGLARLWVRDPHTAAIVSSSFVTVLITAVLFYGCSRFRDGIIPLLCLVSAYGATGIWDRFRRNHTSKLP